MEQIPDHNDLTGFELPAEENSFLGRFGSV